MSRYHHNLPQLSHNLFLTDGGIETTLIFREGLDLPEFAAFDLLKNDVGYQALYNYFQTYAIMAHNYNVGLVLESPTWRANPDWGAQLGYDSEAISVVNHKAIALLHTIRQDYESEQSPMVISGCVVPRGDGYVPDSAMTAEEAQEYHQPQIGDFEAAGADLVTAITMNYVAEAIGITRAAQAVGIPVVISFTLETDGRLPTGQALKAAIEQVDRETNDGPVYYMINCAHPIHFASAIAVEEPWRDRIRGLRANASTKSHAELEEAEDLDDGNPRELGNQYRDLKAKLKNLTVLGGCCGTDERHVDAICQACLPLLWTHLSTSLI